MEKSESLSYFEDFKTLYRDWQALRIIRDNYFDNLRIFIAFYSAFTATFFGVCGYIITNRPLVRGDVVVAGLFGVVAICLVLLVAVLLFFYSKRAVGNIRAVLEQSNDAAFFADKVLYPRGIYSVAICAALGLIVMLVVWCYVMFIYYGAHS